MKPQAERKTSLAERKTSLAEKKTSQAEENIYFPTVFGNQVWTLKSDKNDKQDQKTKPCIWMASGAVAKKNCNNYFNCTSCKYDTAMQQLVADKCPTGERSATIISSIPRASA
ncbi:MAG: hypothetical protein HQK67_03240, partial [Desulfamplus sp.]|nr:hypothetical protein [Desulfamplus sp.]